MSEHPLNIEFWAEGVTIEGKRLTVEEAEDAIEQIQTLTETIKSERERNE